MFGALLKAKNDVEAKITALQRNYLQILNSQILNIEYSDDNNESAAKKLLKSKLVTIQKIKEEYSSTQRQHEELINLITEVKESTQDLDELLNSVFESLNIEIPEELRDTSPDSSLTKISPSDEQQESPEAHPEESDKENSHISHSEQEEDSESESDKENSRQIEDNSILDESGDYFSPNILMQKSNTDCFTPAVKGHSKLPIVKRQL